MRLAVTIIQDPDDPLQWHTARPPGHDVEEHKAFIKSLPSGEQLARVLYDTGAPAKRRKVSWSPASSASRPAKKSARRKVAAA